MSLGNYYQPPLQWMNQQDNIFFQKWPDRQAHIRKPFGNESHEEFATLGPHEKLRRRIILYKVPADNAYVLKYGRKILKIPYLLFGDETVEDTDEILLPVIQGLMEQVRAQG